MERIRAFLQKLRKDEKGATATEYAVMLVLIIVVALATIAVLGTEVEKGFDKVVLQLQSSNP